jgi:hypothetical protein
MRIVFSMLTAGLLTATAFANQDSFKEQWFQAKFGRHTPSYEQQRQAFEGEAHRANDGWVTSPGLDSLPLPLSRRAGR